MLIGEAIAAVLARRDLSEHEMAAVFGHIMDGDATPAQIGGLLVGLRMKGETAGEIAGAARAMRDRAVPIRCAERDSAVDTCGTGGDGSGTVNISTMAALVVAAAGGRVAKHGNRALSSRAGSADVLEALGIVIDAPVAVVERCLDEIAVRGATRIAEWDAARGTVEAGEVTPSDFGLAEADPAGLQGGDVAHNAAAMRRVIAGETGAMRTATLMAAAAALVACGLASDYRAGAEMAAAAIDRGDAARTLDRWAQVSRS
jgi:anthranilate phosphoribosyltransferase